MSIILLNLSLCQSVHFSNLLLDEIKLLLSDLFSHWELFHSTLGCVQWLTILTLPTSYPYGLPYRHDSKWRVSTYCQTCVLSGHNHSQNTSFTGSLMQVVTCIMYHFLAIISLPLLSFDDGGMFWKLKGLKQTG